MNGNHTDAPPSGNILIVDDNPENLRLLSGILKAQGYQVRSLRKGSMTLSSALNKPPDIILLDILMPDMDGYEVCRLLKANEKTREIPVIFISALSEAADKVKGFSLGAIDYITKPFQEEEILSRIQIHLSIHSLKKQLEIQNATLRQAKEKAEQASKAKSQFLSNMGHEVRTPMNALMGFISLTMGDPALPEHCKEYLAIAYESAGTLLNLFNSILDLSRMESDRMELENVPFYLGHKVRETIDSFGPAAKKKGLALQLHIDDQTPQCVVCDPSRLQQALFNLVENAVKFTEKGFVKVSLEPAESESTEMVRFSIKDTGIGIPADRLETIFNPFFQIDGTTTRKYGGAGLGTTISRSLIEMMGGRIWVESWEGEGSVFYFTIRVKQADANECSVEPTILEPAEPNDETTKTVTDKTMSQERWREIDQLIQALLTSFDTFNPAATEPFLNELGQYFPEYRLNPIRAEIETYDFKRAREATLKLVADLAGSKGQEGQSVEV